MATHKSAEKRARQAVKRNSRNSQVLGSMRTTEKKLRTAIAGGDKAAAKTLLTEFMSRSSKAACKGVLPTKTASRSLSRLSERVHKMA